MSREFSFGTKESMVFDLEFQTFSGGKKKKKILAQNWFPWSLPRTASWEVQWKVNFLSLQLY